MTSGSFWDETTKELLGWPEVMASLSPVSPAGLRAKRQIRPYLSSERSLWEERMDDLLMLRSALGDEEWAKELRDALRQLPDVEGLLSLIEQGATLRPVDFFELKRFCWQGFAVERLLQAKGLCFRFWEQVAWEEHLRRLNPPGELVPSFSLAELSSDAELVRLHREHSALNEAIFAEKKAQGDRLRARYGRKPGKDGQLVFDRSDPNATAAKQDQDLQLMQETVFEAIFQQVEPERVQELLQQREDKLVEIEDRETEALQDLVSEFRPHAAMLLRALSALGRLDLTLAKAHLANRWQMGAVCWESAGGAAAQEVGRAVEGAADAGREAIARDRSVTSGWTVEAAFHPLAREAVEKRGGAYTALDLELDPGVGLITGPNMGGKTVVLKTLGLLQALAQHALPVPARLFRFRPVERIGISGGDEQSLASGLSSFGAEMQRLSALLGDSRPALLLLDEVARTTNPEEGEALAIGLASYLLTTGHSALFASHFPGVTEVNGIQGFRVAGLKRDLLDRLEESAPQELLQRLYSAMDYRLLKSCAGDVPKDAVRLAKCFGLPQAVLEQAQAVLQRKEGPTS
ncbi:MutS-related protein [Tumebacillus lipolyticus]|uniref:DNA mismatch repair proteins mutS family domain-containing protein n=1 Tax=Tumebacillus lipolyticus TaxID=1280370 RepID=A0ABW4ZYB9_9BACL